MPFSSFSVRLSFHLFLLSADFSQFSLFSSFWRNYILLLIPPLYLRLHLLTSIKCTFAPISRRCCTWLRNASKKFFQIFLEKLKFINNNNYNYNYNNNNNYNYNYNYNNFCNNNVIKDAVDFYFYLFLTLSPEICTCFLALFLVFATFFFTFSLLLFSFLYVSFYPVF